MDYKSTLNLPKTDFPMRGNLPVKEKQILQFWEDIDLYGRLLDLHANDPQFVLHDGPPYANGNIHLGHALNKILKDIIVKSKFMSGFRSDYVPGWDCHGLPIEHQAEKELKAKHQALTQDGREGVLPHLCGSVSRHPKVRIQKTGQCRGLGPSLRHHGFRLRSNASSRRWQSFLNGVKHTGRRSPSTGASTAGRPWPRRRSSTRWTSPLPFT